MAGPDYGFIQTAARLAGDRNTIAMRNARSNEMDSRSRETAANASAALDRVRAAVLPGFTESQIGQNVAEANRLQSVANTNYDINPFQQALLRGQAFNQSTQGQVNQGQAGQLWWQNQPATDVQLGFVGRRMGLTGDLPTAEPVSLSPSGAPAPIGIPAPLAQPRAMPGGGFSFGGMPTIAPLPAAGLPTVTGTGVTGLPRASAWDTLGPAGRARLETDMVGRTPTRSMPGYAKGTARVPGKGDGTVDTQPAMLAPGEAVLNKSAAETIGRGLIAALNQMGSQKMGMV